MARQDIVVDHHVDRLVLSDGGAGFAEGGGGTGVEVIVGPLFLRWMGQNSEGGGLARDFKVR